jgi:hypothetical protein
MIFSTGIRAKNLLLFTYSNNSLKELDIIDPSDFF